MIGPTINAIFMWDWPCDSVNFRVNITSAKDEESVEVVQINRFGQR